MRRVLMLSAAVLSGTFAFASEAKAGTQDVHFNGTVASSCTFSNVNNGTLGLNVLGTTLSSLVTDGGVNGTATLSCNNAISTLTASAPQRAMAPSGYDHSTAATTINVTGSGANTLTIVAPNIATLVPIAGTTNLVVNMTTTTASLLPSGAYDFFVTLTVTP